MKLKVVAIVPAAGSGKRLKSREKKPFISLAGKPLVTYALKALGESSLIDNIIVAVDAGSIERLKGIIFKYRLKKISNIVKGGKTRAESVRNCFNAIDPSCDIVLIHDGARPFLNKKIIKDSVELAKKFGGCVTAVPATDTVKIADKNLFVAKTLDRKVLWLAQTPQTFRYDLLKSALKNIGSNSDITDDASMLERIGKKVKILKGSVKNFKITTKEDLKMSEVLL